jgi:LAO/AO transport system kinase
MLDLGSREWRAPIVMTIATDGTGTTELAAAIADHRRTIEASGELRRRRERRLRAEVLRHAVALLERDVDAALDHDERLLAAVVDRTLAPVAAARTLIDHTRGG